MDANEEFSTTPITIDPIRLTDGYLNQHSWRVTENSNTSFSIGGLILHQAGATAANYWLHKVYPKEIADLHINGDYHLHDLTINAPYCAGWNLETLLKEGFGGVRNKINSGPPKRLDTACAQLVNFLGCFDEDVRFVLADGSTMSFKEAKEQNIKELDVLSFNPETKELEVRHAYDIGLRGQEDLYEFELEDGTKIPGVTAWHEFWTKNRGWVRADELTEDDDIIV